MIPKLPKPILFAHRGASGYAPENTLAAFELAIDQNADAIELDVKLTSDQEVIVIHDNNVNRTTNGSGLVSNLDLKSIKELDAGQFFDDAFRGEKIPALDEVFESIGNRIFINIEITNYSSPTDDLPLLTAKIVKNHGLTHNVLFSSFNPLALLKIKKILPDVPIGFLAAPGFNGLWARSFLASFVPHDALHPEVSDTNQNLIKRCHRKGVSIHAYTVNNYETMINLFQWNIDGIFTDDILLAQQARNHCKKDNKLPT